MTIRPEPDTTKAIINTNDTTSPARIRSFVRRVGRMTTSQKKAFQQKSPFLLDFKKTPHECVEPASPTDINWGSLFERQAPLALDIGFGMGDGSLALAINYPQFNWLAVDVHLPGIGALLQMLEKNTITNMRLIEGDAQWVLSSLIAPNLLHHCTMFFPDPWPKLRHHKRRLFQTSFLERLAICIQSGGQLHVATDINDYAKSMRLSLQASSFAFEERFVPHATLISRPPQAALDNQIVALPTQESPTPWYRPSTKFARRAINEGRDVTDFFCIKK